MSKLRFAIEISAQPQIAHHEGGQRRPAPSHSVTLIGTRRQRLTSAVLQAGRTTLKLDFGSSIKLLYFHGRTKLRMPGLTKSAERYPSAPILFHAKVTQVAGRNLDIFGPPVLSLL